MWQTIIADDAEYNPYLTHGMLSIAALHLASEKSEKRETFEIVSRQHQDAAITQYREALKSFDALTAGPIFAMTCLVIITTIAATKDDVPPLTGCEVDVDAGLDHILALFRVVFGARAIVQVAKCDPTFVNSPYQLLIDHTSVHRCPPVHIPQRYRNLLTERIDAFMDRIESTERVVCTDAIERLEIMHDGPDLRPNKINPKTLLTWMATVSPAFVDLISLRNIAALVVLEEVVALLDLTEDLWFLRTWQSVALNAIRSIIGSAK